MENYKGYTIEIKEDIDSQNPRDKDFDLGKMICFHGNYNLGDETDLKSSNFNNWQELEDYLKKEEDAICILPLYLYDHSGISMKCYRHGQHSAWDCGQVGFIYTTKKRVLELCGKNKTKKSIEKELENEVEIYNKYISDQFCGFTIRDKSGEYIDSRWGYCEYNEALKDAESNIDYLVKKEEEKINLEAKKEDITIKERLKIGV